MSQCVALLGKFIAVREPNIRYLGLVSCRSIQTNILSYCWNLQNRSSYHCLISSSLFSVQENMTRMLMVTDVQDIIKRHQAQIITSLKDPDIRLIWSLCVLVSPISLLLFHSRSTLSKMCCWNNQVSIAQFFLPKSFLSVTCA